MRQQSSVTRDNGPGEKHAIQPWQEDGIYLEWEKSGLKIKASSCLCATQQISVERKGEVSSIHLIWE